MLKRVSRHGRTTSAPSLSYSVPSGAKVRPCVKAFGSCGIVEMISKVLTYAALSVSTERCAKPVNASPRANNRNRAHATFSMALRENREPLTDSSVRAVPFARLDNLPLRLCGPEPHAAAVVALAYCSIRFFFEN